MKNFLSAILICVIILTFAGCTEKNSDSSNSVYTNATTSTYASSSQSIASSEPSYTSENSEYVNAEECKITEKSAVQIAFTEVKKYEDEYELIIPEYAINNYTCEISKKDGILIYNIIFKDLQHKTQTDLKVKIGAQINADNGDLITVLRFK